MMIDDAFGVLTESCSYSDIIPLGHESIDSILKLSTSTDSVIVGSLCFGFIEHEPLRSFKDSNVFLAVLVEIFCILPVLTENEVFGFVLLIFDEVKPTLPALGRWPDAGIINSKKGNW
jgi:hypothetical protein